MSNKAKFNKLLEPGNIGKLKIKNRFVRVAAGTDYMAPGGFLNLKKEIPYFQALARGGVGLIIIGALGIDYPMGVGSPVQERLDDDKFIPDYSELAKIVHKYGCPIFAQFMHPGAWRNPSDGLQPISASSIPLNELQERAPEFTVVPRELTVTEIIEIENTFVNAADRARRAGFDGIEINAATCHLANSFLSRAWNRRQDSYGFQSFENRARFVIEIKDAIKKRLGQDVPVGILINGAEYGIKDGLSIEETQTFAHLFEKAGFDYISVRVFGYMEYFDLHLPDSIFYPEPPKIMPEPLDMSHRGAGITVPVASAIKKVVSIPVITVGRLDAETGEKILEQGKADYIGLGRRLIADPEYPNKVASGQLEDIIPCTFCLSCFGYIVDRGEDMLCRINGAVGSEQDYAIQPALKKKKVVIIGGGPGGMEAARVAALRGHDVTLFEKGQKLGGLLPLAAMIKGFEIEDLREIIKFYNTQLSKLGVKIKLGIEADTSLIKESAPDVLIVATGGKPVLPDIPGIENSLVVSPAALHRRIKSFLRFLGPGMLRSLTRFYLPLGKKIIVMGGKLQGAEVTEFLIKRGRQVIWMDTAASLEDRLQPRARTLRLFRWLAGKPVTMITNVKYKEITNKGLTVILADGKEQIIEADNIIPVTVWAQNTQAVKSFEGAAPEVFAIGDCKEPRLILDAVGEGFRIAKNI